MPVQIMVQQLLFLLVNSILITVSSACAESERLSLLDLKSGLDDPSYRLSSWTGCDCCSWAGVGCDNRTGHVIRLDLRFTDSTGEKLSGKLNPSLVGLTHLNYLDLSWNDFQGAPLPQSLASLGELRYLNLSYAGFSGPVPLRFGNMSSLRLLDLSGSYMSDDTQSNLPWLRALGALATLDALSLAECGLSSIPRSLPKGSFKSLTSLDISGNKFNSSIPDWLFDIATLEYLNLAANSFRGTIPPTIGMSTSLTFLDVSANNEITGPIPKQLGNLCSLQSLDLSYLNLSSELVEFGDVFSGCIKNSLEVLDLSTSGVTGNLPDWLGNIKNLRYLRLFGNSVYGSLPDWISKLSSLQTLDITDNQLNGTVETSIGQLSSLVSLGLGRNSMTGTLSEAHFDKMSRLKSLDLSENSLVIDVSPNWSPSFRLEYLAVSPCRLGPRFPRWLRNQTDLHHLEFSNAGIEDTMPRWFWNLTSQLEYLDISNNRITGRLPESLVLGNGDFVQIYMNSNRFEGSVPQFPPNVAKLDLSNNSLSGSIPPSIADMKRSLIYLSLSTNNLTGTISSSVCELVELRDLDLSNNHLSGKLPNCWNQSSKMQGINFASNNFFGTIPSSICLLPSLQTMHLSGNRLAGEIPSSLKNCTNLITLDLGYNLFSGNIPSWIGEWLPYLKILSFRANTFMGKIPRQLSQLQSLQILDLSHNNLSGVIPRSFGNFSAMKVVDASLAPIISNFINFNDYMLLFIKGRQLQYEGLLSLLRIIDLSDNDLSGNIPVELWTLVGLQSLNLSKNHVGGAIHDGIGDLRQLESLDLSRNQLSGAIPPSLATLTSLSYLNLSYNSLAGRIPPGNQLQTLVDPSIYVGNPELCGFPLPRSCRSNSQEGQNPTISNGGDDEDEQLEGLKWALAGAAPGLVVGISTVCWVMLFHKKWSDALFGLVDSMYDSKHFVRSSVKSNTRTN